MDKIYVEGIRLFGYHGCLDEEAKIGTEYQVDICVWGNLQEAIDTDDLSKTLDYVIINRIATKHVLERSKLIETVADRILTEVFSEMPQVQKAKIKLSKLFPPINGDVQRVAVELKRKRP